MRSERERQTDRQRAKFFGLEVKSVHFKFLVLKLFLIDKIGGKRRFPDMRELFFAFYV